MIQRQEKQLLLARSHQKPSKINCLGKRQKKEQSWREKRILEWGYGKARCIVGWRAGFQWHASISRQRSILIQDTRPLNSCICQPQQRNIHGCISGGFFMRKAFELAFSNAYAFAGAAPCIFEVDGVDFLKPASLNPLLSNIAVWNRFWTQFPGDHLECISLS